MEVDLIGWAVDPIVCIEGWPEVTGRSEWVVDDPGGFLPCKKGERGFRLGFDRAVSFEGFVDEC